MPATLTVATQVDRLLSHLSPDEQEDKLRQLLEMAMRDPSQMAFPPLLPVELAMNIGTPKSVCDAHGVSKEQFVALMATPLFRKAFQEAREMLSIEGMSFKIKAKLQAEHLLATSFAMATNTNISDSVRADLIKSTVRWAGLDKKAEDAGGNQQFAIVLNLG